MSQPSVQDYQSVPGPRGHPLFGVTNARPDTLNFYLNSRREYGELTRYVAFKKFEWYFVAHPDDIEQAMLGSHEVYYKGMAWDRVRMVLGEGLLVSDGELWRRERRLMMPAFHRCHHAEFAGAMSQVIADMVERWRGYTRSGEAFDVADEMMRVTLMNVGHTFFGSDMDDYAEPMGRALHVILDYVHLRAVSWEAWRDRHRFKEAMASMNGLIARLVAHRRAERAAGHSHRPDLLDTLLDARDEESGEPLSDAQMRDEIVTVIVAGHETAGVALAWTWYLLSQNPEANERLQAELDENLGARLPTMEDLPNLPYLKMVVQEAMRLYPPVWGLSRQVESEVELRGYRLPKKALLLIFPYVTHRHPDFWDDPEKFVPERFNAERSVGRHRFAYFPFGGGPRMCLGASFAMLELQLIVAMVAQRYTLKMVPGHVVEPALWPSLRLRHGLMVTLHERKL